MKKGMITVEWYDANQRDFQTFLINDFKDMKPKDIFIKKTTYGKLIAINDFAVLIQHEEDDYETDVKDCTAIPRCWIIKPRRLKQLQIKK